MAVTTALSTPRTRARNATRLDAAVMRHEIEEGIFVDAATTRGVAVSIIFSVYPSVLS